MNCHLQRKPDKILSAGALMFGFPTEPSSHVPDFRDQDGQGRPLCLGCGKALTPEIWASERCDGGELP